MRFIGGALRRTSRNRGAGDASARSSKRDTSMRKALLGTTALVAAGVGIGDAQAADTVVQLGIGGRYMGAAGVLFDENSNIAGTTSNTRNYVFKQDVEV